MCLICLVKTMVIIGEKKKTQQQNNAESSPWKRCQGETELHPWQLTGYPRLLSQRNQAGTNKCKPTMTLPTGLWNTVLKL